VTQAGPFWMQRATAATTSEVWGWAYVYIKDGRIVAVEWLA
jgi:hypothetical protein